MRRSGLVLHLVAAAATIAALGPALGAGYVLVYDMVFTPHLPLSWDTAGLGSSLPRAVPQDAVVAVLSTLVPGAVLQKIALAAAIYLSVLGAALLTPAERTAARVAAGLTFGWSAFVAERLFLGHWSLLLAYASLPWIVRAALRGSLPAVVGWSALAAITPTGGLLALARAAVTLAFTPRHTQATTHPDEPEPGRGTPDGTSSSGSGESWRARVVALAAVAALNGPWIAAGVLAGDAGRSDATGVAAFAARAENWSGTLGAVLGLGGVWNGQVVPGSRTTAAAPLFTAVLLAVAAYGFPVLHRQWKAGARALLVLALGGLALALLGAATGGRELLAWLVAAVPGAGLLRDGQKFAAPFALLVALCFGVGAERLAARLVGRQAAAVLVVAALLPVAALPDLVWGGLGRLRPVAFPADWDAAAAQLAVHGRGDRDELVVLPLSTFRAYGFNAGRTSLDHTPRYFPVRVVADDRLVVGGVLVAGESPRVAQIAARVRDGRPPGVRWVLVVGEVPSGVLSGLRPAYAGTDLTLYEDPRVPPQPLPPLGDRVVLLLAYALAAAVLVGAAAVGARGAARRRAARQDRVGIAR